MQKKQIHPLKRWLFENQIAVKDFASQLSISRNHLSEITLNHRQCSIKLARKIEAATGGCVTKEQILFHE